MNSLNGLLLEYQQTDKKKILLVTHSIGGGIEQHLDELSEMFSRHVIFFQLCSIDYQSAELVLPDRRRWRFNWQEESSRLCDLLKFIRIDRIHYHHLINFPILAYHIGQLLDLPHDITVHDYFLVNGNPVLLDDNNVFSDDPKKRASAVSTLFVPPDGLELNIWRNHSEALLRKAKRVIFPSFFTKNILNEHFEKVGGLVGFHPDFEKDSPYPDLAFSRHGLSPLDIVIIGAINKEKGADLLECVAAQAKKTDFPLRFSLIGYSYRSLGSAVKEYGPFNSRDLDDLLSQIKPGLVWFPTLCAETYSYVLSSVLRLGIPLIAPKIGAFQERTKDRPYTWLVDPNMHADEYLDLFLQVKDILIKRSSKNGRAKWEQDEIGKANSFFYSRDYLSWKRESHEGYSTVDRENLTGVVFNSGNEKKLFRERFLLFILKLKNTTLVGNLQKVVPYHWQRKIKRALSKKPIHKL